MSDFFASYDAACKGALEDQGLVPGMSRLSAEGIEHDWQQTGGFCRVVYVPTKSGRVGIITNGEWGNTDHPETHWFLCKIIESPGEYEEETIGVLSADEAVAMLRSLL